MGTGYIILAIATFVFGIIVGLLVGRSGSSKTETHGFLYVNPNAPEGQGLFLEQDVPTAQIADEKLVTFGVIVLR